MKPLNWADFSHLRRALLATSCLAAVGATMPVPLAAAPAGLSVGSGQVTVSNPNAQTTLIQQSTSKAILNWNSFSVGSAETVRFQQPNASAVALNRVTGSQASSIFGHLTANGQVFLLNPNGILFGRNSVVNVAGLVATTSGIKDSDFLAGNYNFGIASANPNAGVVNQGTIQAADGGYAVLSGAYVQNDGLIQARLGKVVLAGTTTFAVDFAGDNLLSFAVTGPVTQVPTDANGNPVTALVSNTGSIAAEGGQVTLTARAAKGILDNVINTTGMIEASTATMVNGTIVLDAGDGGVTVGGGLSATGLNPGETGGTINVLGGTITIASGATINASGDSGGGSIFIGGNFHGAGPLSNAWTTNVQQGATILADAITYGNGGNVAVWADGYTAFNGAISAQGGALGGNGGFVETSGHQGLSVQTGTVNTLASNGQVGTWLLDPMNITVVSSGGANSLAQESSFTSDAGQSDTINASLINGAASNVTLQATNNITFNSGVSVTTSGVGITAQAGNNINVAVGSTIVTNGGSITLSANDPNSGAASGSGSITFGAAGTNILTTGSTGTATGGSITLTTNGGTGSINMGSAPIQTNNGAISISAGSGGVSFAGGFARNVATTGASGTVSIVSGGGISFSSGSGILTNGANVTLSANASGNNPSGSGSITFADTGITTTGMSTGATTGNLTNGSATLTVTGSTTGLYVGQTLTGTGIPANTIINAIAGSNVTLSNNATATGSNVTVNGNNFSNGAISMTVSGGSGNLSLGTAGLKTGGGSGSITLSAPSISNSSGASLISSSGSNATPNASGGAINITTTSGGLTLVGAGLNATGGGSSTGGAVSVASAGSISLSSGVGILTNGANVTVSANDSSAGTPTGSGSITLTNAGISTTGRIGTTVSMTSGSTTLTVLDNVDGSSFKVGQTISGVGIPSGTTIAGTSGSTITLSSAATVTASDVFVRAIGGSSSTGGAITLKTNGGSGAISLGSAGLLTAGGDITLNSASVTSNTNAPGISSSGGNASGASSGAGGNVTITTTSGGVTLGGGIITSGTFNSSNVGGNSGSVNITSAGAVDIGGGLSLITTGSGSSLSGSVQSINTAASSPSNTSQTTGNGGAISVTGTSVTLELGTTSNGGSDAVTNSTSGGGNAGSQTLTATGGNVVIGGNSTGGIAGLSGRGGDSMGGSGGAGANITVSGTAISEGGKISTRGGDTFATSGVSGGNAGNISLTATGTDGNGHSIRLYGSSDSATDTDPTTITSSLSARGGEIGITQQFTDTGTVTGRGGNVTLQGSGGGTLQGDVVLQTSTASALGGGSVVGISVGGGNAGTGGTLTINGAVNATTANVESLRLIAGNGSATVAGAVGGGTALNSLVLGSGIGNLSSGTSGAITFQGPVTVATQIQDLRGSGSLTFNGFLTTPLLQNPGNNGGSSASLAMLGGGLFTGDIKTGGNATNQTISLASNFTFASSFTGNLNGNRSPNFIIAGPGSFDSSAVNRDVIISSISSNSPFAINTGSGNLTISSLSSSSGGTLTLRGSGTDTITSASGPVSVDSSGLGGTLIIGSLSANGSLTLTSGGSGLNINSVSTPSGLTVVLRGTGFDRILATSGPVVYDLRNFSGTTQIMGGGTITKDPPKGAVAALIPPPPPPPPINFAPPPMPLFVAPVPVPIVAVTPPPAGPLGSAPSDNAPTTVQGTDTGGSMFSQISPEAPNPGGSTGSSTGGSSGSSTTENTGTASNTAGSSSGTTGGTSSTGGTRGGTGGATGSTTGSTTAAAPPDSGDRAMSVIAQPPPVQPVSHPLPVPPRVTSPVIPGFVSQVQHPVVPKSGTPGVQQGFSASGNSGRW